MMLALAVDTSTDICSLGILEDGKPVASVQWSKSIRTSRHLAELVGFVLKAASLSLEDMDAVAAAIGPGLFTGLRVGVAFAKGLAWSLKKPLFGINTLEALAARGFGARYISPVIDGRKGQVFCALFEAEGGRLKRLLPDASLKPDSWAKVLKERCDSKPLLIGNATELYRNIWDSIEPIIAPVSVCYDLWVEVAKIAAELYEEGLRPHASEVEANYVRASDAELSRKGDVHGDSGR